MKKNSRIFFFYFFSILFCTPLSADENKPPFSFLDGITYSKQPTAIYTCPSKSCKKVIELYENCQFDYYEPTGNGDYGEWLRIRGFICIANKSIIQSMDVDGYVLDSHTAQQIGSFYLSLNTKRDYEFKLLIRESAYCHVFDSKKRNIKNELANDKCKIYVNYATEVTKQTGWLFIDNENSNCKLKLSESNIVAIHIFKNKK